MIKNKTFTYIAYNIDYPIKTFNSGKKASI